MVRVEVMSESTLGERYLAMRKPPRETVTQLPAVQFLPLTLLAP
jgi:hypothetical protein